jgi:putative addiction module killer protein
MRLYEIEEYVESNGKVPFREWLLAIKDAAARAKLLARIDRASYGNFGDWKPIKNAQGLFEMREHYGPGFRIYYAVMGRRILLLLAGSTKADQSKAIAAAKSRLNDYHRRKVDDDESN